MKVKAALAWFDDSPARKLGVALVVLCAVVYLPLAGNYGMWDPWETHYGEVARQMLERNDFVSQWWPGSPQDRAEFWSKPVLTFWLMALGMKAAGIEWGAHAPAAEIAASWRAEWGARAPLILLSIAAIWSVYELVRRLAGRRAGALAAVVLATSAQWVFITRQAMTDMAFVAPMTIALSLAGLALLLPDEERERELERGALRVGRLAVSYPRARAFYGFLALTLLTVLPQLVMLSAQLTLAFRLGSVNVRLAGIVPMLPYFVALTAGLWWCARARTPRQLYLYSGYVLCGLASLAKGPAGLALPAIVLAIYLVVAGRWRDIVFKLDLPQGALLFVATAFPWYHGMLIRHGMGFWNEFIGDNYVHRAGGRHGDRGSFDYYMQWLGYGMFPWSGLVTVAGLLSFERLKRAGTRGRLVGFALVWFIVEMATMSLVNTKFHHYILPALPALAILVGLLLDDVLARPGRVEALAILLVATPITLLCGRDLAAFPPRLLWLFNYDYVNMPGTGRPWPLVSDYGNRYEYGPLLYVFAAVAALVTMALGLSALRRARGDATDSADAASAPAQAQAAGGEGGPAPGEAREASAPDPAPTDGEASAAGEGPGAGLLVGAGVVAVALGAVIGPAAPEGLAPTIAPWAWLAPAALMLPFLWLVVRTVGGRVAAEAPLRRLTWALVAVAVMWAAFLADKLLIELSPHWSQKHVIAAYYKQRKGPDEPLIAWQLYWRGENFYTKNALYNASNPADKTVFLGERNAEKLQQYFASHAGRRVFFVVERVRFEALRNLLPQAARSTLEIVDKSNNKIYLAVASI